MKEIPLSHKYTKVEDRADLMIKKCTKPGHIMETGDMVQDYRGNRLRGNFRGCSRQNNRENHRNERYGNNNRDRNRSRERTIKRSYGNGRDRSSSNDRSRSGLRASTNSDRIRCYAYRYDHFVRDCPNSREERDLEQLQHMLNMEEQDHRVESSDEDYRSPLNL